MKTSGTGKTLLIVDDDPVFRKYISRYLSKNGLKILIAHTGREALDLCSRHWVDLVLLDQRLPDKKGVELCKSFIAHNDQCKIIFITAYPSFDNAVAAIKEGAYDYLSKPFELEELDLVLDRALRALSLEQVEQIQQYQSLRESQETVLIGRHKGLAGVQEFIDVAASFSTPVLITGETGSGKGLVAKSIHFSGRYQHGPFISVNCAALSENLIESELFGHEKGAFTGAQEAKKGVFEMAEDGTLFLDEIGTLPLYLQSKLLGVLDAKEIRRVGGESSKPVDVRIIAATNMDVEEAVKNQTFREDLYFRLNVLRIHVPPLRDRIDDIPELCHHFVRHISNDSRIVLLEDEVEKLKNYSWPGNVRELQNIIERAFILRKTNKLHPSKLLETTQNSSKSGIPVSEGTSPAGLGDETERASLVTLPEMEKHHIHRTLQACSGNRSQAAQSLGIARATLLRKIKAYNL